MAVKTKGWVELPIARSCPAVLVEVVVVVAVVVEATRAEAATMAVAGEGTAMSAVAVSTRARTPRLLLVLAACKHAFLPGGGRDYDGGRGGKDTCTDIARLAC